MQDGAEIVMRVGVARVEFYGRSKTAFRRFEVAVLEVPNTRVVVPASQCGGATTGNADEPCEKEQKSDVFGESISKHEFHLAVQL